MFTIYVNTRGPVAGADNPLGPMFFMYIIFSVHLHIKFFPFKDIFPILPIQMPRDLSWHCHIVGQGYPRVMIYINFVDALCQVSK